MHQEFSACGTASAEHHLNTDRRSQTSRKASQTPQNEVRQKINIKEREREKGFRDGDLCLEEGDVKGDVSADSGTPSQAGTGERGLPRLRGERSDRCSAGRRERVQPRDRCWAARPGGEAADTASRQRVGPGYPGSGSRGRTPGEDQGRLPWRSSQRAGATQLGESRGKPGPPREAHASLLWEHSSFAGVQDAGPSPSLQGTSRLQPVAPEIEKPAPAPEVKRTLRCPPPSCERAQGSLPTASWAAWHCPEAHSPTPPPWGSAHLPLPGTTSRRFRPRHSPCTLTVSWGPPTGRGRPQTKTEQQGQHEPQKEGESAPAATGAGDDTPRISLRLWASGATVGLRSKYKLEWGLP